MKCFRRLTWMAAAMTLGVFQGCAIPEPQPYRLSRAHFSLMTQDGQIVVRDLGSTLGTIVNDQPLGRDRPSDGDNEEEQHRSAVAQEQDGRQRDGTDGRRGDASPNDGAAVRAAHDGTRPGQQRGREHDGHPAPGRNGKWCRRVRERGGQGGPVAAVARHPGRARNRAEGACLQHDGDRIQAAPAQPDQDHAEGQQ